MQKNEKIDNFETKNFACDIFLSCFIHLIAEDLNKAFWGPRPASWVCHEWKFFDQILLGKICLHLPPIFNHVHSLEKGPNLWDRFSKKKWRNVENTRKWQITTKNNSKIYSINKLNHNRSDVVFFVYFVFKLYNYGFDKGLSIVVIFIGLKKQLGNAWK